MSPRVPWPRMVGQAIGALLVIIGATALVGVGVRVALWAVGL